MPQTQNKAQWLAACGHVSESSQSLRFILSLRMNSSFITSRPAEFRILFVWVDALCPSQRFSHVFKYTQSDFNFFDYKAWIRGYIQIRKLYHIQVLYWHLSRYSSHRQKIALTKISLHNRFQFHFYSAFFGKCQIYILIICSSIDFLQFLTKWSIYLNLSDV